MSKNDKRRVMKDLTLGEISLVDQPMQDPARVAILKRASDNSDVLKRIAITSMAAGHAHSVLTANFQGGENRIGQTSYVDGHAHDWVMDEAGNIFIADAQGHNHGIAVLTKNQVGAPAAGSDNNPAGTNKAATSGAENDTMTPEQLAALQKAADDNKQKVAELEKANARSQSILKLSRDQREHFDTLKSVSEQDAFLAQNGEQRDAVIKNLRDADPVVYTTAEGTQIRKSAGEVLISMAKRNDQLAQELAKSAALAKQADLEKRAGTELPNLGGDVMTKAALLGAVDGISDTVIRGKVLETLKAHDAGLGKAFQRVGSTGSNVEKSASDRLDDMAKAWAEKNKVTLAKAYNEVLNTSEGQALYAETRKR